jgi:hypothetical protein
MRIAKFRVTPELLEHRDDFLELLPRGTEIVSETKEDLYTVFVVKHDDLPEQAIEHGAEIPFIVPVIHTVSNNFVDVPVYVWDWNLK